MAHSKESPFEIEIDKKSSSSIEHSDNEIELRELVGILWTEKYLIAVVTAFFAAISILYALSQVNIYRSDVLLAPVEQESVGGLSRLTGQLGGLASLAGVNFGGNGNINKTVMALEVLKSRQFTHRFIEKYNILPELMAAESWSIQKNEISYDDDLYDIKTKQWVREVSAPLAPKPSMQEAYKVFSKNLNASLDEDTGMVTLSFQHLSPYLAQKWVSLLVKEINAVMKEKDVAEARESTKFLEEQLSKVEIAAIREVLFKLIEEQTKTIMFAEVRDEYVFRTIDAAVVPEEKFKPKRVLILVLGTMFGLFISIFTVLAKSFTRKESF